MLLTIKGNEYGLEWGQLAFENLEDELDMSGYQIIGLITEELAKGRDRTLRKLSYEAIKLWCRKNNKPFDLSVFEYASWLDHEKRGSESVQYISDSFYESWYQGKAVSEWIDDIINLLTQSMPEDEESKKVTAKKKSTPARKSSKTATSGASREKTTKS